MTALIVIIVGFSVAMCFQLFIHEKTGLNPPKLPWHKWLRNPQFFLVSTYTSTVLPYSWKFLSGKIETSAAQMVRNTTCEICS